MTILTLALDGQNVFTRDLGPVPPVTPPVTPPDPPVTPPVIPPTGTFARAVSDAFNADKELNWLGGDTTLAAPIMLSTTVGKTSFGIRGNGAKINCAFNDPTKKAINLIIPSTAHGVAFRNWNITDMHFGGSGFAGAIGAQCWTNQSWIYAFKVNNISCDGHAEHAIHYSGSVFECDTSDIISSGGLGLFRATERGVLASDPTASDGDRGLPSAMTGSNWRCRDFNGDGALLESSTPYREPFDLRINEGYFVTGLGQGCGVNAPSGLTEIQGVGFEFLNNVGIFMGYRGGRVIRCQATNPVAGATFGSGSGMAYLVHAQAGNVLLDGCSAADEGSGSGIRLAKIDDMSGGRVMLNPTASSLTGADCDWNGPNANFHIVQYGAKP